MKRPAASGTPSKDSDGFGSPVPSKRKKAAPKRKGKGKGKGSKDTKGKKGRSTTKTKGGRTPKAKARASKRGSPKAKAKPSAKGRGRGGPKATFARRVKSGKEPSASFWQALRDAFETTIQGLVKHPSKLEDRNVETCFWGLSQVSIKMMYFFVSIMCVCLPFFLGMVINPAHTVKGSFDYMI